jgi:phenylacetate-CoA ligase
MLVVRGVNVYPSEIEALVLADEALAAQYAIVVDRRRTLVALEVHAELRASGDRETTRTRLEERLESRLRVRVAAFVGEPGSIPRQEVGKARRLWERTGEEDPFR